MWSEKSMTPMFANQAGKKHWEVILCIAQDCICWTLIRPVIIIYDVYTTLCALNNHLLNTPIWTTSQHKQRTNWKQQFGYRHFARSINVQNLQQSLIEGLVEYGYNGFDLRSKKRHLLDAILTDKWIRSKHMLCPIKAFGRTMTLVEPSIKISSKKFKWKQKWLSQL